MASYLGVESAKCLGEERNRYLSEERAKYLFGERASYLVVKRAKYLGKKGLSRHRNSKRSWYKKRQVSRCRKVRELSEKGPGGT